ncbi:MAG: MFS transporter [Candidatus Heimdallarchaeaceae archaeon]|jgi:GPH family glycoside/pentoside/hexuronide:cation symporter
MKESEKSSSRGLKVPLKFNLAFATGEITDAVAYQGFSFLIFTFYYAVVGIKVEHVMLVYILWSIYNAINDPVLGGISDKTRTRRFGGGRRRPWMIVAWIPLSLIMFFLFTPFSTYEHHPIWVVIYFFLIICIFDTIYTAFSLNRTSLYPEMFRTDKEREEAGAGRRIMMVIGLILAMGLPTVIFMLMGTPDMTTAPQQNYWIVGAILGIIVFITAFINLKWGVKEPPVEELERKETFGIFKGIWYSLKNWKFLIFVLCSMMNWYIFALFPMIMPIYTKFVLGMEEGIFASILLLVAFISSAVGVLIWSYVDNRLGSKMGFVISQAYWAIVLIPLFFVNNYWIALVLLFLNGIGLGGSPYFIDRNISNVVDEDELKTGQRREAAYYGVHALIIRLSTILAIGSVSLILSRYGWEFFNPERVTPDLLTGLKSLVSFFPAGALVLGIVFLLIYPLNKKNVAILQDKYKQSKFETIK